MPSWYNGFVPTFGVETGHAKYPVVVERGILARLPEYLPKRSGKLFVVTNEAIWQHYRPALMPALHAIPHEVLFFPAGEESKRFASVETLADQMIQSGGDRSSAVAAFGGGIVGDMGGFLAAIFMRGIPVIQIPTTLLAQVDAAVGGKTGVNLRSGKNLIGSFHQPNAVLIDPDTLATLPEREYRAGLYEVIKHGVIASEPLFNVMKSRREDVLNQVPDVVDYMICESVRIKADVVSKDEKESDLRRILNFGHTFGHALEAETGYAQLLHGEAVAWGMKAATHLAHDIGLLSAEDTADLLTTITSYGPIPSLSGITAESLEARLVADKKTVQGKVHYVLPDRVGHVVIRGDVDRAAVLAAIRKALAA